MRIWQESLKNVEDRTRRGVSGRQGGREIERERGCNCNWFQLNGIKEDQLFPIVLSWK